LQHRYLIFDIHLIDNYLQQPIKIIQIQPLPRLLSWCILSSLI